MELRLEGEVEPGLVAISTVRQGSAAIEAEIRKLTGQGRNAIVVDAETESDLASVAAAGQSSSTESVMVGSAGLAYALADDTEAAGFASVARGSAQGPVLVVAGSAHQALALRSRSSNAGSWRHRRG